MMQCRLDTVELDNYVSDYELSEIMSACLYINTCCSNKKKDVSSLSYIITRQMSHSDCIKLGIGCEKLFCDIIITKTKTTNIKRQNIKGVKETDHLFMDTANKIIYYAELKANINLDTEKSQATVNKCLQIVAELQEEYNDYEIKWCLLAFRYTDNDSIPIKFKKKYVNIEHNLFGINQYFEMLGVNIPFTEEKYHMLLNNIANKMFTD